MGWESRTKWKGSARKAATYRQGNKFTPKQGTYLIRKATGWNAPISIKSAMWKTIWAVIFRTIRQLK